MTSRNVEDVQRTPALDESEGRSLQEKCSIDVEASGSGADAGGA
jgi:hypothetical protein